MQTEPSTLSVTELVHTLAVDGRLLVEEQLALFRLEAQRQLRHERAALAWSGVCALLGFATFGLLATAAVLATGRYLGGRYDLAAFYFGAGVSLFGGAAGAWAWRRRVHRALPASRAELGKEMDWLRKHLS